MAHSVVEAGNVDLEFAHDLARDNMASYGVTHGRVWDTATFITSWPQTENFLLLEDGVRVGILRLSQDKKALFVRDLQVLPVHQGRGTGTFAMDFVQRLATDRRLAPVRLRMFADNPARSLYERLGFREVSSERGVLLFEKS
jgi:GNAT superfamily N-acetyltransferase